VIKVNVTKLFILGCIGNNTQKWNTQISTHVSRCPHQVIEQLNSEGKPYAKHKAQHRPAGEINPPLRRTYFQGYRSRPNPLHFRRFRVIVYHLQFLNLRFERIEHRSSFISYSHPLCILYAS